MVEVSERMLAIPRINHIKNLRNNKSLSINENSTENQDCFLESIKIHFEQAGFVQRKQTSITCSRYYPYLPVRIAYHLNTEPIKLRKEHVHWLMSIIIKHSMQEIDERFYELLPVGG